ncbi:MAG: hypothetical protein ABW318_22745 [Vicinamibacterales bacterium]
MDVSLERRIEILEENMEQLRDVPVRLSAVESQIVQLRAEMQTGFSALRGQNDETRREMARLNDETRRERARLNDETHREMVSLNDETRREMVRLTDETRREMTRLNDETNAHLRVLHEEVISRIALLQEGRPTAFRKNERKRKRR